MSGKIADEKIEFKPKFIERYSKLTDFEKFKKSSLSFLRRSIRVNTLKISVIELKKKLEYINNNQIVLLSSIKKLLNQNLNKLII